MPIAMLLAPAIAGENSLMRALSCWFKLCRRVGQAGERDSKRSLIRAEGALNRENSARFWNSGRVRGTASMPQGDVEP
jgi:hypothetical protein